MVDVEVVPQDAVLHISDLLLQLVMAFPTDPEGLRGTDAKASGDDVVVGELLTHTALWASVHRLLLGKLGKIWGVGASLIPSSSRSFLAVSRAIWPSFSRKRSRKVFSVPQLVQASFPRCSR